MSLTPAGDLKLEELSAQHQQIAIDCEIALADSTFSIATSNRLLSEVLKRLTIV